MRHAPLSTIKNALARVTHSRKDQLGVDLSAAVIQEQVLPTFVLDADGRVIVWNRACETLTGLTAAELLGTNEHWKAFYASERPCLVDLVLGRGAASRELYSKSETQGAQGAMHAENWCELTNGKRAYLSIIASPIRGSDGKLLAAVETLRDLTAEKLAEDRLASERLQQTEKIAFLTDQLGRALNGLAQGDLVSRIDAPFAPDVEALKRDFNAASADLLRMVVAIGDIARHVEDETANIAQATDELAQRTERQAASVEETSAALTQVSSAVRRNSQEALEAELLVGQAKLHAQESQEVMSAALRAMSGIQRFAQDISQVIAVIDDMAFQTNLLALNAGVEAARAGEAGRGFAVVASEVRALARRSAEAAKEIKALIAASAAHVTEGVTQVNGTATKLTRMGTEIERISGIIQNMSGSARDQSVALDEISRAVAVIDRDTQQNAAMVEEVTAASSSLSEEGRKLVVYTSRFTTAAAPAKALSRAG